MRILNKRTSVQYNEESLVRAQLKALEQRKRDLVCFLRLWSRLLSGLIAMDS
jgi:hypothetical protein